MRNLNISQPSDNWVQVHFDKAEIDKKNLTAFMKVNFKINGVEGTKYIAIENIPVGNDKALKEANKKLGTMLEKSLNAYVSKHNELKGLHYTVIGSNGTPVINKNLKGKLSARIRSYLPGNINKLTKDIGLMFSTKGHIFSGRAPWSKNNENIPNVSQEPKRGTRQVKNKKGTLKAPIKSSSKKPSSKVSSNRNKISQDIPPQRVKSDQKIPQVKEQRAPKPQTPPPERRISEQRVPPQRASSEQRMPHVEEQRAPKPQTPPPERRISEQRVPPQRASSEQRMPHVEEQNAPEPQTPPPERRISEQRVPSQRASSEQRMPHVEEQRAPKPQTPPPERRMSEQRIPSQRASSEQRMPHVEEQNAPEPQTPPPERRISEQRVQSQRVPSQRASSEQRKPHVEEQRAPEPQAFERISKRESIEATGNNYDRSAAVMEPRSLASIHEMQHRIEELYLSTIEKQHLDEEEIEFNEHDVFIESPEDYPAIEDIVAENLAEVEVPVDYTRELVTLLNNLNDDERNIILDLQGIFHISDENLLKIYDDRYVPNNQRGMFLNTLKEIVEFEFGNELSQYQPRSDSTFGWSTANDGSIFIRMGFKGEGSFMKASSALCLNNMKEYINLSPRKGDVTPQPGVPKEQIDRKQKEKIFNEKTFQEKYNQVKIKEAQNKEILHNLGIPNIVPLHLVSYTSPTKNVGPKTSYIVEKSEDLYHAKMKKNVEKYDNGEPLQGVPLEDFNILIENSFNTLKHLHSNNYSHNDLKPDNFIMSPEGGLYLADFDGLTSGDGKEEVTVTTPMYWSPEYTAHVEHHEKVSLEEGLLAINERRKPRKIPLNLYGTIQNDAYAMGIMYLELLFGLPNPVAIFMDNNPDLANKWTENFYQQDIDKIDAEKIPRRQKILKKEELLRNYNAGNYEVNLGDRFRKQELLDQFMDDLRKELDDRNLFPNEMMKDIAILIINGLLTPDPAGRMSMEDAYNLHLGFLEYQGIARA